MLATIDASVVLARILAESRPSWVDETFRAVEDGAVELISPPLLWLEVGNRLVRSRALGDAFALEAMLRAEALPIASVDVGRPIRWRAILLGREHGLTMHDATYLAVAEAAGTALLTLDHRLDDAAAAMGLQRARGPGGISEPSSPYGDANAERTSLAAIGATLAAMRRQSGT